MLNVPLDELDQWERRIIFERKAQGYTLRNIVFNFGAPGPSALDKTIPIEQQEHWATGGGDLGYEQYAIAAKRPPGPTPKLFTANDALRRRELSDEWSPTGAELITDALGVLIAEAIPDAPRLEGDYWTVSDYPSTAGGRYATLNVGHLELAFSPRWPIFEDDLDGLYLNLPPGTLLTEEGNTLDKVAPGTVVDAVLPSGTPCVGVRHQYRVTEVDCVIAPVIALLWEDWEIAEILRTFVIDLMRAGTAGKFTRWHSHELARRAYERVVDMYEA